MKIGVMTFHWADNYGAVLQSYALVRYLRAQGYDAEDIDYVPRRLCLRRKVKDLCSLKADRIRKPLLFRHFRKEFLVLSKKKYHTNRDLFSGTEDYDAILCGSDQIWNAFFCMHAETAPTLSYFLNFARKPQKRISYAASFGANELDKGIVAHALPELQRFDAVSVREDNAVDLLRAHGISAELVCDPTLLLDPADYDGIAAAHKEKDKVYLFNYMLRRGRESTDKTDAYVKNVLFAGKPDLGDRPVTPEEWLYQIRNCEYVVTDSFHGTVFAILFHKPFVSVNDAGCAMNARIRTLLARLGLTDRMLEAFDEAKIRNILSLETDWVLVDEKRTAWRKEAEAFLARALQ